VLSRPSILIAALIGVALALAPAAHARKAVSVGPTVGEFETTFTLVGTGWRPSRAIRVEYYNVDLNRSPFRTFSVRTDRNGRASFRLVKPQVFAEQSVTQRLCFVQSGARRCGRFYVAAPAAHVEPNDVTRGQNLLLLVTGWPAGFNLEIDLFRPDGVNLVPAARVATRSLAEGFEFAGAPFNNIFVPRGGAFLNFLADAGSPVGTYVFHVHPAGQRFGSRTAFVVSP
jgi:hypothetical protein